MMSKKIFSVMQHGQVMAFGVSYVKEEDE